METGSDIWTIFFEECDEQLGALDAALARLAGGTQTPDCINVAFRAVHSIKGGGGIFGLAEMVGFAHVFETALGFWRDGRLVADAEVMALLQRAAGVLAGLAKAAAARTPPDQAAADEVAVLLAGLDAGDMAGKAARVERVERVEREASAGAPELGAGRGDAAVLPGGAWQIRFTPHVIAAGTGHEIGLLLHELGQFGEMKVMAGGVRVNHQAEIKVPVAGEDWLVVLRGDRDEAALRDVFSFTDDGWNLRITRVAQIDEDGAADAAGGAAEAVQALVDDILADAVMVEVLEAPEAPEPPQGSAAAPPAAPAALVVTAPVEVPPHPAAAPEAASVLHAPSKTVRVDLDRVDRMIDLVGELVINGSMLGQKLVTAGLSKTAGVALAMRDLELLTREIQDTVMLIRAQPVRAVFQRMTRLVRDVSAQTGKPARLVTAGDDTELDQTVIERIGAPLTQLIRNAIDHGLEDEAVRREAAKPAEGVISLRAMHRSGRIVLEVGDDGGGFDRARIRAKAIERGLLAPDAALSQAEIDELIFLPGFSTAAETSEISGSGEGMDAVRRSVQALGGRISVASRAGAGSCFTMSLPLTLAVLDGMVVECGGQTIIVPLAAITETLKPRAEAVHDVDDSMQVLALRGGFVPLVDVAARLRFSAAPKNPVGAVALLVETERGAAAALLVDRIIEQRQVVVKRLETNFRAVPCIAAATVLGDGRVALILDVEAVTPPASGRSDPRGILVETMQAEAA